MKTNALAALLARFGRLWTALGCAARLLPLLLLLTLPAVVQAQFNYATENGTITITGYTGPGGARDTHNQTKCYEQYLFVRGHDRGRSPTRHLRGSV